MLKVLLSIENQYPFEKKIVVVGTHLSLKTEKKMESATAKSYAETIGLPNVPFLAGQSQFSGLCSTWLSFSPKDDNELSETAEICELHR